MALQSLFSVHFLLQNKLVPVLWEFYLIDVDTSLRLHF